MINLFIFYIEMEIHSLHIKCSFISCKRVSVHLVCSRVCSYLFFPFSYSISHLFRWLGFTQICVVACQKLSSVQGHTNTRAEPDSQPAGGYGSVCHSKRSCQALLLSFPTRPFNFKACVKESNGYCKVRYP
jgi:hypothetical protein